MRPLRREPARCCAPSRMCSEAGGPSPRFPASIGGRARSPRAGMGARMLQPGDQLTVQGTPPAHGPVLLVCNHVSWLDILRMHAARHVPLRSKSDVRHWPVIGTLSTGGRHALHRARAATRRDARRAPHGRERCARRRCRRGVSRGHDRRRPRRCCLFTPICSRPRSPPVRRCNPLHCGLPMRLRGDQLCAAIHRRRQPAHVRLEHAESAAVACDRPIR